MSNATGTGKDFNPYQILTGDYMRILNGDMGGLTADTIHPALKNGNGNAGAWSLGGKVAYSHVSNHELLRSCRLCRSHC